LARAGFVLTVGWESHFVRRRYFCNVFNVRFWETKTSQEFSTFTGMGNFTLLADYI
jgi:hypothetical protein